MAKVKKRVAKLGAKKKWVKILAPKMFNNYLLGETYVFDAREALGKTITVNLMTLTKNPKNQGINVSFSITGQHEEHLTTEFIGLRIMPSVARRFARRGKNKIEDSFICMTLDGYKIRIKPLMVTRNEAKGSALAALRREMRIYLTKAIAKTNYDTLSKDIVDRKLQKELQDALKKIYPLSGCHIRWLILLGKGTASPIKAKKKEAKTEEKPKAESAA
ncbi:hypothetical protein JW707_04505 [Candidatus Woesearchaeota archaeon]|nr:hypothetical protein [Candidatus Woesearchaeota archaeon]